MTWVDKEAFRFNARDVCYGLMIDQRCLLTLHRIQVKRKARADNFLGFLFFFFFQKPYTVDVMNTYNVFSRDLHSHLKSDMSVSRDNFMLPP